MARVRDVAFGMLLGTICTGVIASLAATPTVWAISGEGTSRFPVLGPT